MATEINTDLRNAMVSAAGTLLNSATIEVRTGAPAGVGNAASGTVLATLTANATAFANPVNGTAAANAITEDSSAAATGTAAHFRVVGTGSAVMEGLVSATGGGGEMELSVVGITLGDTVAITSWSMTQPA